MLTEFILYVTDVLPSFTAAFIENPVLVGTWLTNIDESCRSDNENSKTESVLVIFR